MVRYLNLSNHHPVRVTKTDNDFARHLVLKIQISQSKSDIHKNEKENSIGISVFAKKIEKNIQLIYQNNAVKKNMLTYY